MNEIRIDESELFAKQVTEVEILPYFYHSALECISVFLLIKEKGTFGPFRANKPIVVPLWFAIYLKVRDKCRIIIPEVLLQENLKELIESERKSSSHLLPLQYYFFEVAYILMREFQIRVISEPKTISAISNPSNCCLKSWKSSGKTRSGKKSNFQTARRWSN